MQPDRHDEDDAGPHIGYLGSGLAALIALSAIWMTVFSASNGVVPQADSVYDFIIVGGGTAGCVLAARLSEVASYRVLLLEAGLEEPWMSNIPLSSVMLQGSKYDWQYYTEQQNYSSFGMNERRSFWARGKMLGGSSQMNFNIHTLGLREHYDRWQHQHGLEGWGSTDLLHSGRKALCEQRQGVRADKDSPPSERSPNQWGLTCSGGPVRLSTPNSPVTEAFHEAARYVDEGSGLVHSTGQVTVAGGRRWSTLKGYLRPAMGRSNLHVVISAHVDKIVFEGQRAVAVDWHQWGSEANERRTFVRGEVVLSAGVINSPQILMASGVGRREDLESLGIAVVSDVRGVGCNLVDHLNLPLYATVETPVTLTPDKMLTITNFWNFFVHGEGLLTESAIGGLLTKYSPSDVAPVPKSSVSADPSSGEQWTHSTVPDTSTDGAGQTHRDGNFTSAPKRNKTDKRYTKDFEVRFNNVEQKYNEELTLKAENISEDEGSSASHGGAFPPSVGLMLFNMGSVDRESYAKAANMHLDTFDSMYPDMTNASREGVFLLTACLHPSSRGWVTLNAAHPRGAPTIQPNFLQQPQDVACIRQAFRLAEAFVRAPSMQKLGVSLHYPQLSKCGDITKILTRTEARELVDGKKEDLIRVHEEELRPESVVRQTGSGYSDGDVGQSVSANSSGGFEQSESMHSAADVGESESVNSAADAGQSEITNSSGDVGQSESLYSSEDIKQSESVYSDADVDCLIRTMAFTGAHPVGTLRMGKEADPDAVVDMALRVRGVQGVRVMDASVLPSHPAPAPVAILTLMAERAADIIKSFWSPPSSVDGVRVCLAGACNGELFHSAGAQRRHYSSTSLWLPLAVTGYVTSRIRSIV